MTSPLRANQDLKNALIKRYSIKDGVTIAKGARVRFGGSDTEIDNISGADDDTTFATALEGGTGIGTTVWIEVALDFPLVVAMVVGTGGATRGKKQKIAADGVTDAPANGGGTTSHPIVGVALQTGVAGDLIGVGIANSRSVTA